MTDDFDVLTRLVDYHDHIDAPTVPVPHDVRRGRRRLARRRSLAAGGAALAVAGIVLTASLVSRSDLDGAPDPARTPTPTPSETHTAIDLFLPVNGPITSAERYLGVEASGYAWRSFDPVSQTGLFVTGGDSNSPFHSVEGLAIVERPSDPSRLFCAQNDLPCSPEDTLASYVATLGPGAHEVTVESGDGTAQVIGLGDTVPLLRRTIDLTATITGGEEISGLRWSPDGSRLAVLTDQFLDDDHARVTRAWLVDREGGGDPQLAYSLWLDQISPIKHAGSDFDGEGAIWTASAWGWSPDGQTLLLDVRTGEYGADVVLLHAPPDGPATAQTLYHSNRYFDWTGNLAWSPDGTRIAVRTRVPGTSMKHRVTEISAEDGSVIAQHPHNPDWLIWVAKEGSDKQVTRWLRGT